MQVYLRLAFCIYLCLYVCLSCIVFHVSTFVVIKHVQPSGICHIIICAYPKSVYIIVTTQSFIYLYCVTHNVSLPQNVITVTAVLPLSPLPCYRLQRTKEAATGRREKTVRLCPAAVN